MKTQSIILLVIVFFICGVMVGVAFDLYSGNHKNINQPINSSCVNELDFCTQSLNISTNAFNEYINTYCK